MLAPGQAQPYYQGDPLPIMQSATAPTTNSPFAADSAAARSATGKTLAWNAPASNTPSPTVPAPATSATQPWGVTPQASAPIARANEAAVSVPTDTDNLRFALPSPAVPQSPLAPAAASTASTPPNQPTALANGQGVALASYNAPAGGGLTPVGTTPTLSPTPPVASPWRAPQVGNLTSSTPGYAQPPAVTSPVMSPPYAMPSPPAYAPVQTPSAMPTNAMAVELRSVPSPPLPGDPMPRVRVPGYDTPETAAADGFRPRTSMR
jgi:hypothetical protein